MGDDGRQLIPGYVRFWSTGNFANILLDEPSHREHMTADDNGFTLAHSAQAPMTLSYKSDASGVAWVKVSGMEYRTYFTNTNGYLGMVHYSVDEAWMTQGQDGVWLVDSWSAPMEYQVLTEVAQQNWVDDF
ncbi:hypothetical protein LJ756_00965 [Arthrobacter sp. zg-Y411]|uniref:hypothetical protein n=1 Tax=Arthrobacter zhangbolii TaxID=2886936 RepID=UPI001D157D23|nr:hypothetical protein [Arthrobacter zhangbolii]MCC3293186.1 hypothetical protein [Arthrobacter zhangbolii]